MMRIAIPILLLLLTVACGGTEAPGAAPDAPTPAPAAAAPTPHATAPEAVLPDGTRIALELAISPEEHAQGLMFRPTLGRDRGMLFLFEEPTYPSFWMKDTWVPLDIVFLDGAGRVVEVAADAQPCRQEPCPQFSPRRPAAAVLEVPAGTAAAHALVPGAELRLHRVPGYPRPAPEAGAPEETAG